MNCCDATEKFHVQKNVTDRFVPDIARKRVAGLDYAQGSCSRMERNMLATNKIKSFMLMLIAGIFVTVASIQTADAQDRRVRVINETSFDMIEFYGSNVGTDSWEEDILGRDVLRAGKSVMVNFDDGSGYCMFDFMGVFSDGEEVIKRRVNVCQIGSFRFTE